MDAKLAVELVAKGHAMLARLRLRPQDREDLVHEGLVRVLRRGERVREATVTGYYCKVLWNIVNDYWRRHSRWHMLELDQNTECQKDRQAQWDAKIGLTQILKEVPPNYRAVLKHRGDGLDCAEIAHKMQMTRREVSNMLYRATLRARERVAQRR